MVIPESFGTYDDSDENSYVSIYYETGVPTYSKYNAINKTMWDMFNNLRSQKLNTLSMRELNVQITTRRKWKLLIRDRDHDDEQWGGLDWFPLEHRYHEDNNLNSSVDPAATVWIQETLWH